MAKKYKIAVIGSGTMGNGIAHVCAQSGNETLLLDINDNKLQHAMSTIKNNLKRQLKKNIINQDEMNQILYNIQTTSDLNMCKDFDLIIEAIPEKFELKSNLFKQLDKIKEQMEKKAFERNKNMAIAQAIISTATAAIGVYQGVKSIFDVIPATIAAAGIIALGAAQVAMIASQSYQGGGGTPSSAGAPTSITAGERGNSVDLARSQSARGEIAYMRGESGTGGPENFRPAFSGARYRAAGGETTGYVVGEQGPELFVPTAPGTIVPNDDMAAATNTNVSFNINAVDAAGVEDLLVAQRGNIIGMIREAANSYGEDFVESVDTSILTPSAGGASRY